MKDNWENKNEIFYLFFKWRKNLTRVINKWIRINFTESLLPFTTKYASTHLSNDIYFQWDVKKRRREEISRSEKRNKYKASTYLIESTTLGIIILGAIHGLFKRLRSNFEKFSLRPLSVRGNVFSFIKISWREKELGKWTVFKFQFVFFGFKLVQSLEVV